MKKALLLIFIISLSCNAQDKKGKHGDIMLFSKGIALYELANDGLNLEFDSNSSDTLQGEKLRVQQIKLQEDILDKSLDYFEQLLEDYPKSKLYFRTLNNKAQIEFELKDFESAKETYIQIIESKAKDKELGGVGSGIMAEPYANYKNRALKRLAEIEYIDKNYNQAIEYLDLTKKYPYLHFCGNEFAYDEIYMATQYALNYIGLNDRKTALQYLLPQFLENGLANNKELVELAVKILKEEYGIEQSKLVFEKAKRTLNIKKIKQGKNEYNAYFIKFEEKEIELATPFEVYEAEPDKEMANMIDFLNNCYFSKLLNE